MYKRLSAVLFPVMTLFLIGALVWGYRENQEKNSVLIKAENQYQRAFHDLSYHMDRLHSELGNTLAVNTTSQGMHRKSLMNVWRLTSEAQNEINQLPLTLMPFNHAEDFLSRISNFAYQTSVRDLTKEPLSEREIKNLKSLYSSSDQITKDLQQVQSKVISNNLRWMDVEMAMASEHKQADNTIIDGFKTVDKKVTQYSELDWGPTIASIYDKRSVKKLDAAPESAEQIQQKAAEFAGANKQNVRVTEQGKGTEWASYTASVQDRGRTAYSMDFTRKGGKLISYENRREIGAKQVDRRTAQSRADRFLEQKGYPGMTAVSYDEYGNIGNFTYARKLGDVIVYPEKMTVRVGLDNGEVTGFQSSDYVYQLKQDRKMPKPKLDLKAARGYLNPDFKELYHRMALIKNDLSTEVLCYEFGGGINGTKYKIFINADNGQEESVEEIRSSKALAKM
ncbi:germination protein YpeB [Paenibacillus sp. JX-17]|uniref:Germination protein YpeB n=1 Tax=Paenibacillus lacisoli TaxID=3064525 RepID=A0ABT9C863_9BACL|nr:germination protein YpeB [Paenibacillus sp. JX-17]MDO7905095.1 germination protein YpeB [Paenibacillus sp. JX-17]